MFPTNRTYYWILYRNICLPAMAGYDVKTYSPAIRDYMERVREALQPHYDDVHAACRELNQQASQAV